MLDRFEVRGSIAELVICGSAIFWFLFLVFRFVMRRDVESAPGRARELRVQGAANWHERRATANP